jgi:coproporphyrinogen dehydrogenase
LLTTTSDGYVLTHQGKFLGNNVFQSFLIDENQNEIF